MVVTVDVLKDVHSLMARPIWFVCNSFSTQTKSIFLRFLLDENFIDVSYIQILILQPASRRIDL